MSESVARPEAVGAPETEGEALLVRDNMPLGVKAAESVAMGVKLTELQPLAVPDARYEGEADEEPHCEGVEDTLGLLEDVKTVEGLPQGEAEALLVLLYDVLLLAVA